MRDPERIEVICNLIKEAMNIDPDIRFGQLLYNCGYIENTHKVLDNGMIDTRTQDPFYYEDDRLIELLVLYIKENARKTPKV